MRRKFSLSHPSYSIIYQRSNDRIVSWSGWPIGPTKEHSERTTVRLTLTLALTQGREHTVKNAIMVGCSKLENQKMRKLFLLTAILVGLSGISHTNAGFDPLQVKSGRCGDLGHTSACDVIDVPAGTIACRNWETITSYEGIAQGKPALFEIQVNNMSLNTSDRAYCEVIDSSSTFSERASTGLVEWVGKPGGVTP
jgi:hypothetical protein